MAQPQMPQQPERRFTIDCRNYPGTGCSLSISGTEGEVIKEAMRHAVADHGYKDDPQVREELRKMMKEEGRGYRQ